MFGFSAQETVGDVLTSIGLLGGLIGLFFLGFQVKAGADQAREAAKQATASVAQARTSADQAHQAATAERGRFVLDVINRYFDDKEMLRLYSLIDSDSFVFSPDTPIGDQDVAADTGHDAQMIQPLRRIRFLPGSAHTCPQFALLTCLTSPPILQNVSSTRAEC